MSLKALEFPFKAASWCLGVSYVYVAYIGRNTRRHPWMIALPVGGRNIISSDKRSPSAQQSWGRKQSPHCAISEDPLPLFPLLLLQPRRSFLRIAAMATGLAGVHIASSSSGRSIELTRWSAWVDRNPALAEIRLSDEEIMRVEE